MNLRVQRVLMLLLLLPLHAVAQGGSLSFTNGDGVWKYTTNGGSATIIGYTGLANDVTVPDQVTGGMPVAGIASLAMQSFTKVIIPMGVVSIGDGAFNRCLNLGTVIVPIGISSLGSNVFLQNFSLTNVVLPEGLSSIGYSAFNNCTSLKTFTIPDTVLSIGPDAFFNCTNLTSIVIPDSITSMQKLAFGNCSGLTNVTFGSGLTAIDDYAFDHCTSLPSINIPTNIRMIGTNSFSFCGLRSLTIPASVTNIENAAFTWCTSLTNVVLPATLTHLDKSAFESCTALRAAWFLGNAPPDLGAFANDTLATVYYLPGSTGWGTNFSGRPTVLWNPQPITPGTIAGHFRFTITGPTNASIIVVASTNLANPVWVPVSTNTLTNGSSLFSDPQSNLYSFRYYRFRAP